MNITLTESDVRRAVELYVESMGIRGTATDIQFVAGRKGTGLKTSLTLSEPDPQLFRPQPNTLVDQIIPEAPAASEEPEATDDPWLNTEPEEKATEEPTEAPVAPATQSLFG